MSEPDENTLDLSGDETKALARRLVANHLYWDTDWLSWEDVPMLSEQAFARLQDAVDKITRAAPDEVDALDRAENIDSMLLHEQASNA